MKYCPSCKNKGWTPSEGFTKPLINRGKQNYKNMSVRYYYCMNCQAKFKTVEKLLDYVQEVDLFDSDSKPRAQAGRLRQQVSGKGGESTNGGSS